VREIISNLPTFLQHNRHMQSPKILTNMPTTRPSSCLPPGFEP